MGYTATHRGVEVAGMFAAEVHFEGLLAVENLYFAPATMLRQLGLVDDRHP
jgi:hypothetical protein